MATLTALCCDEATVVLCSRLRNRCPGCTWTSCATGGSAALRDGLDEAA